MEYMVKKKIGNEIHIFKVHGKNLFECIMEAQKLSFPDIQCCGLCKNTNLYIRAHRAKDKFNYVKVCCSNPDCKAYVNFGQKQEDDNIFYLRTNENREIDWQIYTAPNY